MKKRILQALVISLLLSFSAIASASVEVDGVAFDTKVDVMGQELHLQGAALLKYMVFIKAYVGALYLPESTTERQALSPVAKRLELEYYHAIQNEDFAKATRSKIKENVSEEAYVTLQDRIEALNDLYRDVKPGDRYSLTYLPGQGTELSLNGEPLGSIPGDDFAHAVFSIWLGENPIDKGFRDRLLGIVS